MKEFDVEKLERKNVFVEKEEFYAAMQNVVLQKIPVKKEAKIIKLKWMYSAAAAIALIFGVTFFMTSAPVEDSAEAQKEIVATSSPEIQENAFKPSEEAIALQILEEDLTSIQIDNQNTSTARPAKSGDSQVNFATQQEKRKVKNTDLQVDQILSNFSRAELADLSQNTEQDIYLDLYN